MEFGIFTVGDVTPDPTNGRTPSEHERIKATLEIATVAEEVGLDVFATGEHHNPPFAAPANPPVLLANIAARTERLVLSTSTTLITTNDPVRLAEDYAYLQHLADGRIDLMMGRGNTGPVYPWFGKDIRDGIDLAVENYALLHRLWREESVTWQGKHRTPLQGFTSTPRPLDGIPPFVWHGSIRSPEIAEQAAYYGDGFFHNNIFWPLSHTAQMVNLYRRRFEQHGHGSADQAIVGLGGQAFIRPNSQDAVREFRPYFDNAPVYGHGPSLEDFSRETPLTVGSPQQVIERYAGMADAVGDYQRQLFLMDHAGLPLATVLEQIELLGTQVVPELRKITDARRPAHVPATAPRHHERAERAEHASDNEVVSPMTRRIVALTAGLSEPSSTRLLTDRIAEAVDRHISAHGESATVEIIELRPLARKITEHMLTGFASGELNDAIEHVLTADAVIAVSPVFSGSYSGLFKAFIDNLDVDALDGTPVLIAATGGSARHSLMLDHAMRPLFAYLHASVVPTAVMAATDDFASPGLDRRIDRAAGELVSALLGQARGAPAQRSGFLPADSEQREAGSTDRFDEVTDFAEMLARLSPQGGSDR